MIYQERIKIMSTKRLTKDFINKYKYSILHGAKYFSSDRLQNYLVYISTVRNFWISKDGRNSKIKLCKSTGMPEKSMKNLHTSEISFVSMLIDDYQLKK